MTRLNEHELTSGKIAVGRGLERTVSVYTFNCGAFQVEDETERQAQAGSTFGPKNFIERRVFVTVGGVRERVSTLADIAKRVGKESLHWAFVEDLDRAVAIVSLFCGGTTDPAGPAVLMEFGRHGVDVEMLTPRIEEGTFSCVVEDCANLTGGMIFYCTVELAGFELQLTEIANWMSVALDKPVVIPERFLKK